MAVTLEAISAIRRRIASGEVADKEDLHRAKLDLCREGLLDAIPTDADLLGALGAEGRPALLPLLRQKPSRTASGVAIVSAMTRPFPCPHGVCVYCPGGPRFGTPQSYQGHEPAAMRGAAHGYDAFDQTRGRVDQLQRTGHPTDKVELIILGGTFTNLPADYRESFLKGCFDGLNGFVSPSLRDAQGANETGTARCVGLTVETKPERFLPEDVSDAMRLGVTRVEFGVQSVFDDVLLGANRGHTVEDVRAATRRAKEAGLKVGYHMMPGLPGSDRARDEASLRTIFEEPDFRPDLLKVYPTVVMPGTRLHAMWERGEYEPLTTEDVVSLLARVKPAIPEWVRIQRIQREFGVPDIAAGLDVGNVRELVRRRMTQEGTLCRCIRCREVGLRRQPFGQSDLRMERKDYAASAAREVFVSLVLPDDALAGYARLRLGERHVSLRELKVLGNLVPLSRAIDRDWQHRGLGEALLTESEEIARDAGFRSLRVTSGVGVRGYYRQYAQKRGRSVSRDGPYVTLDLN